MKKKHTAMQQIINLIRFDKIYLNSLTIDDFEVQFKRLLELEKQQIVEAYKQGVAYWNGDEWKLIDIEQYYNETFKKIYQ
jgi:hypothetical protein